MTLLNTANDGYYSVLIALYRALIVEGAMEQQRVIRLCSGKSQQAEDRLKETIKRWVQLELFSLKDDILAIEPNVKKALGKKSDLDVATQSLPGIIRRIVFREENNTRFWDQDRTRSADLTRGLSWLLAQDIYGFPIESHEEMQQLEYRQVRDEKMRILQNSVRSTGLRTWAIYLGFLWQSKSQMIDPTAAIGQDLALIFDGKKELSAEMFVKQAASVLPVLDGGKYRVKVESKLDVANWKKPDHPDALSMSLSRALWRLNEAGGLRLDYRADAGSGRFLQVMGGDLGTNFTHVIWQGGAR
jgi:hypothetical protein